MFTTIRRISPIAIAAALAGLLAIGTAVPALAGDVTGTLGLTGGSLSIATADAPTVALTLDGTNQTSTDTFTIDAKDLRGSGLGWRVTMTSTLFTNAGGKTLAADAARITGVTALCDSGDCTAPTNDVSYTALVVPAAATPPTPATLFNAALDSGMGDFTLTPTFELSVPANAYAGAYSSTITLDIATGPTE